MKTICFVVCTILIFGGCSVSQPPAFNEAYYVQQVERQKEELERATENYKFVKYYADAWNLIRVEQPKTIRKEDETQEIRNLVQLCLKYSRKCAVNHDEWESDYYDVLLYSNNHFTIAIHNKEMNQNGITVDREWFFVFDGNDNNRLWRIESYIARERIFFRSILNSDLLNL